jgi:signal transduction histidine kinase/ActR/RegA family two-component response regulator
LAGARTGDLLTHLGDRPLTELLNPHPEGLWHVVEIKEPTPRLIEMIAQPVEPGSGNQSWVVVMRDVTREREVQERVQQQDRLAAVGQMAAGIAHDFSNIMAVITLYSQMAQRADDISPKTRQRLETVDEQAKRASRLIQQILDFGRKTVMERRPLDMVPLIKEQVRFLQRTLPESIRIALTYGADDYTVNADLTRVQQVILNLAVNARDAMPEGGRLDISLERLSVPDRNSAPLPDMEAGEWLLVRVSDTGVGIPKDQLPHIFEPFFTTKEAGKGTGLGLAQVYGIVKQHDGFLDVSSKPGHGTSFTVYLPALLTAGLSDSDTIETTDLAHGQGQTILVVEDDATVRDALMGSLEALDYRALGASDGKEALDIFRERGDEISLVLTDMVMPRMGGRRLISALRQIDPTVKVVVVTGHPLDSGPESLEMTGVTDWLQKPPKLDHLATVLETVLRGR